MKKLIFTLGLLLSFVGLTKAGTASIIFSEKFDANSTQITDLKLDDVVTVSFDKGTGSTEPQYYLNGTAVRVYGGNTLTISATSTITGIEITFGTGDGTNEIKADTGTLEAGIWTGSATEVVFTVDGTKGNRRIEAITVTYEGEGGGTITPDPVEPEPDPDPVDPTPTEGNITQPFTKGIGFAESSADAPAEAIEVTATNTDITYNVMGCYTNTDYLMVNGKNFAGAYISWSLDIDMSQLKMTTTAGCSTNALSKVNVYAGENLIGTYDVNVQNTTVTVDIPEEYQTAGTVYKVESNTDKYNQQFASFTYVKVGNETSSGETPEPPTTPEGTITVSEALDLMADGYTGAATVKGFISQIDEISMTYGNATYYIVDKLGDSKQLQVYRGYYLDGEKFTAEDQIEVGATVIVEGSLVVYNGTYEFTTGSKILEYTAPTGGETPEPDPDQPGDETSLSLNVADAEDIVGTFVEEQLKDDGSLQAAPHYQPLESYTIEGFKFEFSTTSTNDSQAPAYYCTPSTNANTAPTTRIYNGTSMTVTAPEDYIISKVVFKGSNLGNNANFTVDNGTWTTQNNAEWTGEAHSFTVTANATWRFTSLDVTLKDSTSGVETIVTVDNSEAVYYNLQGVKVANPERGIFIKVQNGNATKVVK